MDYTEPLILGLVAVCLFDVFAYYRYKYSKDVLEHLEKKKNNEKLKKILSTTEKKSEAVKTEEKKLEDEEKLLLKPPVELPEASANEGITFHAQESEAPSNNMQ